MPEKMHNHRRGRAAGDSRMHRSSAERDREERNIFSAPLNMKNAVGKCGEREDLRPEVNKVLDNLPKESKLISRICLKELLVS